MFTILLLFLYHTSVLGNVSIRKQRQDSERYGVPDLRTFTTTRPIIQEASPTWVAEPMQEAVPAWIEEADEGSDEESDEEQGEPNRMIFLVQHPPPQSPLLYPIHPPSTIPFYSPTVQYVPTLPYCCQLGPYPLLPYY